MPDDILSPLDLGGLESSPSATPPVDTRTLPPPPQQSAAMQALASMLATPPPSQQPAAAGTQTTPLAQLSAMLEPMMRENQRRTSFAEAQLRGYLENASKPYEEPGTPKGMAGKALFNVLTGFLGGMPGLRTYFEQQRLHHAQQQQVLQAQTEYVNALRSQQAAAMQAWHQALLQNHYDQQAQLWYGPRGVAALENAQTSMGRLQELVRGMPARLDALESQAARNRAAAGRANYLNTGGGGVMDIGATQAGGGQQPVYVQPPMRTLSPGQSLAVSTAKAVASQAGLDASKVSSVLDLPAGLQQRAIDSMTRAQLMMHPSGAGVTLSPEGLDLAAQQFATTGRMLNLGMGAANLKSQIISRAAQLYPHVDLASNQAAYRANSTSLSQLQTNRDNIVAWENTASKNLGLFLQTAKPIIDTGSPFINMPMRLVNEKLLGNAGVSAFQAARRVSINEIAKVTSNPNLTGQLSDTARKEVESFVPENASLAQIYSVARVLQADMSNRHQSLDDQIGAIQQRISRVPQAPQFPVGAMPAGVNYGAQTGRTVRLRAPDGTERDVPANEVDHYVQRGARRIK